MKWLSMTLLSLMTLSGCTKTVYIEPKKIETYFIDECKKYRIVPNKDGGLDYENHTRLYESMRCHKKAHTFYKKQLLTIRGKNEEI